MKTVDTCALCGEDEKPIAVIRDSKRVYLSACAFCLIGAFDQLTGYNLTKMYMQYEALKEVHAERKRQSTAGRTSPRKGSSYAEILSSKAESKRPRPEMPVQSVPRRL